ncbi:MAG: alpha/beta fold hydrolase [Gemmatimonadaceae bacterium]
MPRPGGGSPPLLAEEIFPAHVAGITVRYVPVRDGVRLRVLEAGLPTGRPVVLVHGWGASAYSYRDALPALAAAGFRAIALDLPGHGLSDKPSALDAYSRPAMTAAVGVLLDALDVRDACVVGVSMGGAIALGLAIERHPRVGAIAPINPAGLGNVRFMAIAKAITPLALRDLAPYLVARPLVDLFLHLAYWDPSRVTARVVDEYWATARQPGYAAAVVACLHRFSWEPYPAAALAGIACPVLLVLGTHDHLIAAGESAAGVVPGLRTLRVVGGHAVNEECPAEVNAALIAFARE